MSEGRLKDLLSLCIPIVVDHMGRYVWCIDHKDGIEQIAFKELLAARCNEHFWIKVSCSDRISKTGAPFRDVLPFVQSLAQSAPDRVLWGTDYPNTNHKNVPDPADLVDFISEMAPTPEIQHRLLVDNPTRLYN